MMDICGALIVPADVTHRVPGLSPSLAASNPSPKETWNRSVNPKQKSHTFVEDLLLLGYGIAGTEETHYCCRRIV